MKVLTLTLLTSFVMAGLAGCAAQPETTGSGAQLPDETRLVFLDVNGRTVPCVIFDGGHAGGITCDWSVG